MTKLKISVQSCFVELGLNWDFLKLWDWINFTKLYGPKEFNTWDNDDGILISFIKMFKVDIIQQMQRDKQEFNVICKVILKKKKPKLNFIITW